ncbi:MAG: CPBP family intramembrane metalloprotease [Armatimonadota bacterium]|nr:CPBP family intramembrane metalloprotease [Armatimonadota bacterium]
MLTAQLDPWLRVTVYLIVVGLALEAAHRAYWSLSRCASRLPVSHAVRAFLMALAACIPLVTACVVTGVFCLYIDRESLATIGIRMDLHPSSCIAQGAAIAFATVTLVFSVGYASGWFRVQSSRFSGDFYKSLPTFCGGLTDFLNASIFEELIMRGYVFTILYNKVGASPAIIGSALIFSIFHLLKHAQLPVLFTMNAFLFGIMAAHCRLATGAIWMPIGLHAGWNLASASVFGLPFAGKLCNMGLITCSVDGPKYITGGYYSPDAGLMGTFALAFAASVLTAVC